MVVADVGADADRHHRHPRLVKRRGSRPREARPGCWPPQNRSGERSSEVTARSITASRRDRESRSDCGRDPGPRAANLEAHPAVARSPRLGSRRRHRLADARARGGAIGGGGEGRRGRLRAGTWRCRWRGPASRQARPPRRARARARPAGAEALAPPRALGRSCAPSGHAHHVLDDLGDDLLADLLDALGEADQQRDVAQVVDLARRAAR
mgnify:CR=1 FL=1